MSRPEEDLGEALRRALEREAAGVRPSPDGLRRIRDSIAADDARRRRARSWLPRWRPLLVAAGAAGLVATSVAVRPLLELTQRDDVGTAAAPSPTTRAAQGPTPTSSAPSGSLPATTVPSPSTTPTGTPSGTATAGAALPVYVVGPQGDSFALFREFRRTTRTDPVDRVQEAVDAAMQEDPTNPAYVRGWGAGASAGISVTDSTIVIELDAAAADGTRDSKSGRIPGELLLQQLIWTATAALASSDPAGPSPEAVRITVSDNRAALFGVDLRRPLTRSSLGDPRGGAWITAPVTGASVRAGQLRISGEAIGVPGSPPTWTLARADGATTSGTLQLTARPDGSGGLPAAGTRGFFTLEQDLEWSGDYVLTVTLKDPGAAASGRVWTDQVTFTVRRA